MLKVMDFVFKMMTFVFKMMTFAFKYTGRAGPWRLLSKNSVFNGVQGGNYQPTKFYPGGKGHGAEIRSVPNRPK